MGESIAIREIQKKIEEFAQERDWEQFHSVKNLSMALVVEASELLEIFQWLKESESNEIKSTPKLKKKVEEEIADVFIHLARIADKCEVNIEEAVLKKIEQNALKYPVDKAKGSAAKYDEF